MWEIVEGCLGTNHTSCSKSCFVVNMLALVSQSGHGWRDAASESRFVGQLHLTLVVMATPEYLCSQDLGSEYSVRMLIRRVFRALK